MRDTERIDRLRRQFLRCGAGASLAGATPLLTACGGTAAALLDSSSSAPVSPDSALAAAPSTTAAPSPSTAPQGTIAPAPAPTPASPDGGTVPQAPLPPAPSAPVPSWSGSLPTDAWSALSGTAFSPWAKANIPPGAYMGTSPFDSIVNAFCDPAHDATASAQYFYGGGHGDGSCNAVCKFDHQTLAWSVVGQPTPPAKYPPLYAGGNNGSTTQPGPLVYPSGLDGKGFFLSGNELSSAVDLPYATALARSSTHMYAAAAKRGTKIHYFYLTYGEFDTASGQWSGRGVDLGAQLVTFRTQYNNVPLQQGTVAVYDEVTDRFYVTLNPGDNGGGWRSGIIVFNGDTRRIEAIYETNQSTYGLVLDSINICRVGRDLYCFTKEGGYYDPQKMNQGFIFNMDKRTFRKFVITGDTQGSTFLNSSTQETIPSYYDGVAIRRWNYQDGLRDKIYSVDPRPVSGTGTPTDPCVLQQTARTIGGAIPDKVMFVYSRLAYHGGAKCALVIPSADSNWLALRLS